MLHNHYNKGLLKEEKILIKELASVKPGFVELFDKYLIELRTELSNLPTESREDLSMLSTSYLKIQTQINLLEEINTFLIELRQPPAAEINPEN